LNTSVLFVTISHWILLRMIHVSDKNYRENQNTRFIFSNFFFSENPAVYVIMWKNFVEPGRPPMIIWHMRIACWISKATNTHSEYVILIAFLLQHWFHERAQILRYTFIACLFDVLSQPAPQQYAEVRYTVSNTLCPQNVITASSTSVILLQSKLGLFRGRQKRVKMPSEACFPFSYCQQFQGP
jgi:hypothetical protein